MELDRVDTTGKKVDSISLNTDVFGAKVNRDLLAQYVHVHKKRRALGTKKTQNQSEVAGGASKPWRQKGTGRARHGSIRSSLWVGGAHAHAIRPRMDKRIRVSKKMRNAALASALSAQMNEHAIVLLQELSISTPKTKDMVNILTNIGVVDKKVLIVLPQKDISVEKSASNLPKVAVTEARLLNPVDTLNCDTIVMVGDAPKILEERITS